jgi:hypothetical protein
LEEGEKAHPANYLSCRYAKEDIQRTTKTTTWSSPQTSPPQVCPSRRRSEAGPATVEPRVPAPPYTNTNSKQQM